MFLRKKKISFISSFIFFVRFCSFYYFSFFLIPYSIKTRRNFENHQHVHMVYLFMQILAHCDVVLLFPVIQTAILHFSQASRKLFLHSRKHGTRPSTSESQWEHTDFKPYFATYVILAVIFTRIAVIFLILSF